jgi:uncharacterized protein (DUF924 family)
MAYPPMLASNRERMAMPQDIWVNDVLDYWFNHLEPRHWFAPNPDIDDEIRDRFEPLWYSQKSEAAMFFLTDPRVALSAIILFDQFPRNMFRDSPDSFATDRLALSIAEGMIEAGFDNALPSDQRAFAYMPYMHSERMLDQDRSVELFDMLGQKEQVEFAILHRDVIRRFGRFPHRNAVYGRESTPDELEFLQIGRGW